MPETYLIFFSLQFMTREWGQEYEVGQSARNAMQLTLVVQQKGFIDYFTEKGDLVMFRRA